MRFEPVHFQIGIRSFSSQDVYSVDLDGQRCTCTDWLRRRQDSPIGNPGRFCKHMISAWVQAMRGRTPVTDAESLIAQACWNSSRGTNPGGRWISVHVGRKVTVATNSGTPWCDVYARSGSAAERYGYNLVDRRWSYGASPTGARAIKPIPHREFDR
jgi:hypothetical protein